MGHAAIADGLTSAWTFDEASGAAAFADATSNGHDLSTADNTGSAQIAGAPGLLGNAMNGFGNRADSASGLNQGVGEFGVNNAFSASFWVRYGDTNNFDQFQSYLGRRELKGNKTSNHWEGWSVRNGSNDRSKLAFRFLSNDGSSSANRQIETNNSVLSASEWLHVVVTHDGSGDFTTGTSEIYVNGTAQGTTLNSTTGDLGNDTLLSDSVASDQPFAVGERKEFESGAVAGKIDELGVWNRVLTSDEVSDLYNNGSGLSMNTVAIPEPASLTLLGLGGLLTLPRRRKRA